MITPDDFGAFYRALSDRDPFPWQARLARVVAEDGWPDGPIDLPTASGKTAVLDIATFHLALEADRAVLTPRRAARRIFFVIDRRVVVDAAFERAGMIASRLGAALRDRGSDPVLRAVARNLVRLAGADPDAPPRDARPLRAVILRGGMARDDAWSDNPAQPLLCASTVDQVGSRLLFRGYGLGRVTKVSHAGLVGNDSLIILDEAHISGPFLDTLESIRMFRSPGRPAHGAGLPELPFHVVSMSATPGRSAAPGFRLGPEDRTHPVLSRRLGAEKTAELIEVPTKKPADPREEVRNRDQFAAALADRARELATMAEGHRTARLPAGAAPVVGVVVNRVDTARRVFNLLSKPIPTPDGQAPAPPTPPAAVLLTGRVRPLERDARLDDWLPFARADDERQSRETPLFVVATQTIEVGADLDFDALVTELAPLDALRQRFGRLDRLGNVGLTRAAILARKDELAREDPLYRAAPKATWEWLHARATKPAGKGRGKGKGKVLEGAPAGPTIDFGVTALESRLPQDPDELAPLLAPKQAAPVLLPAHLDAWAQTDPLPEPEPEIGLFLHGPGREADVQLVWRADLPKSEPEEWAEIVAQVPPSTLEAMPVPLWAVRRWLAQAPDAAADFGDVEGVPVADSGSPRDGSRAEPRMALRWRGPNRRRRDGDPQDDERSRPVGPDDIRPGDTLIVRSQCGGADPHGWAPESPITVADLGDPASWQARRRASLRLHPEVIASWAAEDSARDGLRIAARDGIAEALVPADEADPDAEPRLDRAQLSKPITKLLAHPDIPGWIRDRLGPWTAPNPPSISHVIPYPKPDNGPNLGWLLLAPRLATESDQDTAVDPAAMPDDEDDSSWGAGVPVPLDDHLAGVSELAGAFAEAVGLPGPFVAALRRAGRLHDIGKVDHRFQTWLHNGDEIAAMVGPPLAKSGVEPSGPESRRARRLSGLPAGFRHEAVSVALAAADPAALAGLDPEMAGLVLHLIGTHHGRGRPFWPVIVDRGEPVEYQLDGHRLVAGSSHGLEQLESGWTDRFCRLLRGYGPWGLALLESILMLADGRRTRLEREGHLRPEASTPMPVGTATGPEGQL